MGIPQVTGFLMLTPTLTPAYPYQKPLGVTKPLHFPKHDKEIRYWRSNRSHILMNQGLQSKGHLPLTGDNRREDLPRYRKKKSKQGALSPGNSRGRDKTRHGRGVTEQGALINWVSLREQLR